MSDVIPRAARRYRERLPSAEEHLVPCADCALIADTAAFAASTLTGIVTERIDSLRTTQEQPESIQVEVTKSAEITGRTKVSATIGFSSPTQAAFVLPHVNRVNLIRRVGRSAHVELGPLHNQPVTSYRRHLAMRMEFVANEVLNLPTYGDMVVAIKIIIENLPEENESPTSALAEG